MERRKFIKLSATASALALTPLEMKGVMEMQEVKNCNFSGRRLVLINLDGGNDGLNTAIPINQYDLYSNFRPTIKVPESGINKYISLDTGLAENMQLGLHPSLYEFKNLYDSGKLRLLQSVGYPSQNKSHFASSDIYMTGNDGNGWQNGKTSGWIGRYMEQMYAEELGSSYPFAVQMGNVKNSLGFHGIEEHGMNMNITNQDASGFYSVINGLGGEPPSNVPVETDFGIELDYVIQTDKLANVYASAISDAFNYGSNSITYPDTNLSDQLKTVARLIKGGLESKIYMVRLKGFDTHANQLESGNGNLLGRHDELLKELNGAVGAFMSDIEAIGIEDEVIALTYSEFGRKVAENGNLGTDHGEAAPMFVFGKAVEGGVSGVNPNLNEASEENNWQIETFQFDYRSVFGTVLKEWMGGGDSIIDQAFFDHSNNSSFNQSLVSEVIHSDFKIDSGCITSFEGLVNNQNESSSWFASPNPFEDNLVLRSDDDLEIAYIEIYNKSGQIVRATNVNYFNGKVSLELSNLSRGTYIVKINVSGKNSESLKVVKR
jgi:uncharacterized protein (DUF1501 family)